MDFDLEQYYKNKVFQLEREIKDLKSEYECEHKVENHMAEQISAQKRIIEKRNAVIRKYVEKYGSLDDADLETE